MKSIEMGSGGMVYTYIQGFMNTGASVQAILRVCLGNLKSCNVGITEREFGIGLYLEIEQLIRPKYIETVDR
jgi:hypothetical protein